MKKLEDKVQDTNDKGLFYAPIYKFVGFAFGISCVNIALYAFGVEDPDAKRAISASLGIVAGCAGWKIGGIINEYIVADRSKKK